MVGQIEEIAQEMEDRELAEIARKVAQNGIPSSPSAYLESLEPTKSALLSKLILEEPDETSGEEIKEKWFETVKRVRLRNFKRRKEEIQAKLAKASEDEMVELLRQKKEILEKEKMLKGGMT
jgi:predicted Zn-dependent protease